MSPVDIFTIPQWRARAFCTHVPVHRSRYGTREGSGPGPPDSRILASAVPSQASQAHITLEARTHKDSPGRCRPSAHDHTLRTVEGRRTLRGQLFLLEIS
jgi:hypothetical protein